MLTVATIVLIPILGLVFLCILYVLWRRKYRNRIDNSFFPEQVDSFSNNHISRVLYPERHDDIRKIYKVNIFLVW